MAIKILIIDDPLIKSQNSYYDDIRMVKSSEKESFIENESVSEYKHAENVPDETTQKIEEKMSTVAIAEQESVLKEKSMAQETTIQQEVIKLEEITALEKKTGQVYKKKISLNDKELLWNAVKEEVCKNLYHPNTSIFPDATDDGIYYTWYDNENGNGNGGYYRVSGWCETKNAFGLYNEINFWATVQETALGYDCDWCYLY